MQVMQAQPDSHEAAERRAEYCLLNDFVVSIPMIGSKKVSDYIKDIEQGAATGQSSIVVG